LLIRGRNLSEDFSVQRGQRQMKHSAPIAPDLRTVAGPRSVAIATTRAVETPGARARPVDRTRRDLRARMRSWQVWIAGWLSLVASFVIPLHITEPARHLPKIAKPSNPAVAALARSQVSDGRSLMAAIKAAGLKGSSNVKGAIDSVEPRGSGRVVVRGWAAE